MYLSTEQFALPRPCPAIPRYGVESLLEKGSGELNEDVLLQGDDLFGVFDGATSLDRRRFAGGLTGGLLAARIAARTFQEEPGCLAHLADMANRRIRNTLLAEKVAMTERARLWSTSCAVIRLAADRFEYCQTGDALILLIEDDGGYRLVTPQIDIDRETCSCGRIRRRRRRPPHPRPSRRPDTPGAAADECQLRGVERGTGGGKLSFATVTRTWRGCVISCCSPTACFCPGKIRWQKTTGTAWSTSIATEGCRPFEIMSGTCSRKIRPAENIPALSNTTT